MWLRNIVGRNEGRRLSLSGSHKLRLVRRHKIKPENRLRPSPGFLTFELLNRVVQQLAIKLKAYVRDVPALGRSQDVARAANLQITHRNLKSGSQTGILLDRVDSPASRSHPHQFSRQHKIRVRFVLGPSYSASQLI